MKKHVGYQVSSSQRSPPKKVLVSKTSHGFEDLDPTENCFQRLEPPQKKNTFVGSQLVYLRKQTPSPPNRNRKMFGRLSFLFVVASWQVRSVSFRKCFNILMACQNNKRYKRLSHHPVPRLVSQSFPLLPGGGIPGVCVYRV